MTRENFDTNIFQYLISEMFVVSLEVTSNTFVSQEFVFRVFMSKVLSIGLVVLAGTNTKKTEHSFIIYRDESHEKKVVKLWNVLTEYDVVHFSKDV